MLEQGGRSLWWDRRLASGEDYGLTIEREIDAATCVVVAWSKSARDSLWVRAEANAALDRRKLVQLSFDGANMPLPFTMLHATDLSEWSGRREESPWPYFEGEIDDLIGDVAAGGRWRPDPGGVPFLPAPESPLAGLGRLPALGWTGLGAMIVLAVSVMMVSRDLMPIEAFEAVSVTALLLSSLLLLASIWFTLRAEVKSRR